jgi:hypothetical protein
MFALTGPISRSVSRDLLPGIPAWGIVALCMSGSILPGPGFGAGPLPDGGRVFLTYCAGCHGFDGFAFYPPAPSFSMGERLEKDNYTLLQSVLNGKGGMPPWENKLPVPLLQDAITYLRSMAARRQMGLHPRSQPLPEIYFRFRPIGETEPDPLADMQP